MIFALATDDHGLMVFATEADAVAYCEGIDVAEGGWEFFAADGVPLEPVFSQPASRGSVFITSGKYTLQTARNTRPSLSERINVVTYVEGLPGVVSVADVERLLQVVQPDRARKRAPRVSGGVRGYNDMRLFFSAACFIPAPILGVFIVMALQEWWAVGVVSDPAVLSQYPFGAEGPVADIEHYSSPQAYARHQLLVAFTCIALGVAFLVAWLRKSHGVLLSTYIAAAGLGAWSISSGL